MSFERMYVSVMEFRSPYEMNDCKGIVY